MLTTLVENWPGHRDGIMGPDLMAEMRAQAEKFGATLIQSHVTAVDLCSQPFKVRTDDGEYRGARPSSSRPARPRGSSASTPSGN